MGARQLWSHSSYSRSLYFLVDGSGHGLLEVKGNTRGQFDVNLVLVAAKKLLEVWLRGT